MAGTLTELDAGPELDRLVALAMGIDWPEGRGHLWRPSADWRDCGEVVERLRVHLAPVPRGRWTATLWQGGRATTVTHADPKVAACRCVARAAARGVAVAGEPLQAGQPVVVKADGKVYGAKP